MGLKIRAFTHFQGVQLSMVAGANLTIFLAQAPLDPNQHHDGIMYTAALATAEGATPNLGAFAQYGPLSPLLQGWWLRLTSTSLLSLRVFTALLLTLTAVLLFHMLRRFLTPGLSSILTLVWALSAPKYFPADLPWSSVITTLLLLFCTWLTLYNPELKKRTAFFLYLIAGLITGLGVFGRIHLVVTFIAILVFLVLNTRSLNLRNNVMAYFLGGVLGFGSYIAYAVQSGSLRALWDQSVVWVYGRYAVPSSDATKATVVHYLLLITFPFFTLLLLSYLRLGKRLMSDLKPWRSLTIALGVSLLLLIADQVRRIDVPWKSFRNPPYLAVFISENIFYIMGYVCVSLVVVATLQYLRYPKNLRVTSTQDFNRGLLIVGAAAALTQLYPSWDSMHVWWVTPLLLLAIAPMISKWQGHQKFLRNPLSLGAVSLIFVLIFQLILDLATSREDLKSPALKGMRGTGMVTMQLDSTLLSLSTFGKAKQIAFQCEDGLYAGASAKYMAADQRFVNWGPGGISSLPKTTQIFVCHKPISKLRDAVPAEYREVFNIGDGYGTRNALFER